MDGPNAQSAKSREAGLRSLADAIDRRIETVLGDWFEVESIASDREQPGECDGGAVFEVIVGETGRLATTDEASLETRLPAWRVAAVAAPASDFPEAYRAAVESRVVAVALRTACPGASDAPDLEGMPFPEFDVSVAEQLAALESQVAAAGRGGAVDWAIERVVAEAYQLELSELVEVQAGFSEGQMR